MDIAREQEWRRALLAPSRPRKCETISFRSTARDVTYPISYRGVTYINDTRAYCINDRFYSKFQAWRVKRITLPVAQVQDEVCLTLHDTEDLQFKKSEKTYGIVNCSARICPAAVPVGQTYLDVTFDDFFDFQERKGSLPNVNQLWCFWTLPNGNLVDPGFPEHTVELELVTDGLY